MQLSINKILQGYHKFREKYVHGDNTIMQSLSYHGQKPEIMVVACCDSRVDPALILQCDPGDLFVVRNVANIIPPFEKDDLHHGTSAALEFGICYLEVKHLILLGHSQCGGIQALLNKVNLQQNDFISNWVDLIKVDHAHHQDTDECARLALSQSHINCLTFPWIVKKITENKLVIHQWYFDIQQGQIFTFNEKQKEFLPLD